MKVDEKVQKKINDAILKEDMIDEHSDIESSDDSNDSEDSDDSDDSDGETINTDKYVRVYSFKRAATIDIIIFAALCTATYIGHKLWK